MQQITTEYQVRDILKFKKTMLKSGLKLSVNVI